MPYDPTSSPASPRAALAHLANRLLAVVDEIAELDRAGVAEELIAAYADGALAGAYERLRCRFLELGDQQAPQPAA